MATNNAINTPVITLGGPFTISGAFTTSFTVTANTSLTLPTSGTLATTTQFFQWVDLAGTSQTAVANTGYIISNAGLTTITIPGTIAEGSMIGIMGKGAAGWVLAANTGQTIHLGNQLTTVSLASTNQWDSIIIVCTTANSVFSTMSVVGNLTVN